jgi:tetrahydromethanopterin S-methyltransferase subunit G
MAHEPPCAYITAHEKSIDDLKATQKDIFEKIDTMVMRIEAKIENEIQHRWPQNVAILITILSSLVVGLVTFLVTRR